MPKCRKCDERIDRDHDYCPFCGARQGRKSGDKRQRSVESQGRLEKQLRKHIDYLEGELEDAGIDFDELENEE